jgi:hypothetical protein
METTMKFKFHVPCNFMEDSDDFNDYVYDTILKLLDSNDNFKMSYGDIHYASKLSEVDVTYKSLELYVSADGPRPSDEKEFIKLYETSYNEYKDKIQEAINTKFSEHGLLGNLPDANVIFMKEGHRLFVEIYHGQTSLELQQTAAFVTYDLFLDDEILDFYDSI